MSNLFDLLYKNKEWLFSGAGVAFIVLIGNFIFNKKSLLTQVQKSGKNSQNIQAVNDINIELGNK